MIILGGGGWGKPRQKENLVVKKYLYPIDSILLSLVWIVIVVSIKPPSYPPFDEPGHKMEKTHNCKDKYPHNPKGNTQYTH
jgi:hypothetical protein